MCWRLEEWRLNLSAFTWKFRVQSFIIVLMKIEASACRVVSHSNQMNINLHNYDVVRFKRISTPASTAGVNEYLWLSWRSHCQTIANATEIMKSFPAAVTACEKSRWNFHEKFIDKFRKQTKKFFLSVDILSAFLSQMLKCDSIRHKQHKCLKEQQNIASSTQKFIWEFMTCCSLVFHRFHAHRAKFSFKNNFVVWIAQKREENNLHCWRGNCLKFVNFSESLCFSLLSPHVCFYFVVLCKS